jgi:hypothetical protein
VGLSSGLLVPYAAYLRVYEPLAAFAEPERGHWYHYAEDVASGSGRTAQDELRELLADLLPVPPVAVPVHESRDAFVAVVDGVTHICPWRTRLRGWQALDELADQFPRPVLDAVLPPVVREQTEADYAAWRARNPDARPWIRTATWHVPVRWFVLFEDSEREYEPSGGGESKQPVLRYRTPMVQARRRTARALRALKDADVELTSMERGTGLLVDGLVDVGRWLEEFHPRSMVELDYGGLVHVIPEDGLAADRSAADVAEGLTALREGAGERAGEAYERLVERWRTIRELQYAN